MSNSTEFKLTEPVKRYIEQKAQLENNKDRGTKSFGFFKIYFWWFFGLLSKHFNLDHFYPNFKLSRSEQKRLRNFYFSSFSYEHNSQTTRQMSWQGHFYFAWVIMWFAIGFLIAGITVLGSSGSLHHGWSSENVTLLHASLIKMGGAFVGIGLFLMVFEIIESYFGKNLFFYGRKPRYRVADSYNVSRNNTMRDNELID